METDLWAETENAFRDWLRDVVRSLDAGKGPKKKELVEDLREVGFFTDLLYPRPRGLGGPAEAKQRVVEAAVTAVFGMLDDIATRREASEYWPQRAEIAACAQRTAGALDSGRIVRRDPRRAFTPAERETAWSEAVVAAGFGTPVCALCGEPVPRSDAELDHRVPWARGGRTELANAQLAHARCNRRKGAS